MSIYKVFDWQLKWEEGPAGFGLKRRVEFGEECGKLRMRMMTRKLKEDEGSRVKGIYGGGS